MSEFKEYTQYDALGLGGLVRRGEVQPSELVESAISRIEKLNPHLNAVIHTMYDQAREAAAAEVPDGPFQGVPFLLKDLLSGFAGAPMSSGSNFLRSYVSPNDAEIVQRYRQAGLLVVGKSNTPEFGSVPYTEPEAFGPTRNPWDTERTPGGSSGGSAAAVAARLVPMAHGGDGGGSIRVPASCCGIFGLKPTQGRMPTYDDFSGWANHVLEHVLTRSVRDSAAALDATRGPRPGGVRQTAEPERPYLDEVGRDPDKLRIAFSDWPLLGTKVDPECSKGLQETVQLLETLGHQVVEAAPNVDRIAFSHAFVTMICGEMRADIREAEQLMGRKASSADIERDNWGLALLGDKIRASDYVVALRQLQRTAHDVRRFMAGYDLFLTPTIAGTPVTLGQETVTGAEAMLLSIFTRTNAGGLLKALRVVDSAADNVFDFIPYTPLFNASGQPAMSVPLHWSESGLPVGMHFVGQYGDEATLFRLAGQLEQARPWWDKAPPVS